MSARKIFKKLQNRGALSDPDISDKAIEDTSEPGKAGLQCFLLFSAIWNFLISGIYYFLEFDHFRNLKIRLMLFCVIFLYLKIRMLDNSLKFLYYCKRFPPGKKCKSQQSFIFSQKLQKVSLGPLNAYRSVSGD